MYIIKRTQEFAQWFQLIRDRSTRIRLLRRLEKAQRGLLGDISPVWDGVYEMREFFGPGVAYVLHALEYWNKRGQE